MPIPTVDHHCHGIVVEDLDPAAFAQLLTEASVPAPPHRSPLDSPVGLAVRRWCAPLLDLDPLSPFDRYLDRRAELGGREVARRLLRATGTTDYLVDTGYLPTTITEPDELAALAGARAHEVVRIERVAEELLADPAEAGGSYLAAFEARLRETAASAVGLKSIVAYRGGLALPPPADAAEVERRAAAHRAAGATRLADRLLLRAGLDVAARVGAELELPLQLHTGWGDADLDLHLSDPSHLMPWLREVAGPAGLRVCLLHCYPYHRQAAHIAAVLPTVWFDVGLALPYLGPRSGALLADALELAPFGAQLYSSDAFGLPELYLIAARHLERGLRQVLDGWVAAGDCTAADADGILEGIAAGNARHAYPRLGPA